MDRNLKTVVTFTFVFGLLGAVLFSGQPSIGRTQMADGIKTMSFPQTFVDIQLASAEWHAL
jgi:hypothetical protein